MRKLPNFHAFARFQLPLNATNLCKRTTKTLHKKMTAYLRNDPAHEILILLEYLISQYLDAPALVHSIARAFTTRTRKRKV